MTNEEYLTVSYFTVAGMAVIPALIAYFWLYPSLKELAEKFSYITFSRILRKALPISLFFTAILGFCSVSFHGCDKDTYESIIADRAYLIAKNQEQLHNTFFCLTIGIIVMGFLVFGLLIAGLLRNERKESLPVFRAKNGLSAENKTLQNGSWSKNA